MKTTQSSRNNTSAAKPGKNNQINAAVVFAIVCGAICFVAIVIAIVVNVLKVNGVPNNYPDEDDYPAVEVTGKKPIIYLYPEEEMELTVRLGSPEKLIASYPKYVDGWDVIAYPNGDLIDKASGNRLYALYWEGRRNASDFDLSTGFVVKGEDAAKFLEEKLEILGLNYREKEEFIVYWLPELEANEYNYVHFMTTEELEAEMPLELSVQPDTKIRISMVFEGLDEYKEVKEQVLEPAPERSGFTVVEWGGTNLKELR